MKRNTKIALVMMALSAMAMGSTSAFAHGGHGMWQQNAAPLTSEQQTAWQKIHNDFYAQSSALQQQLVTKRYEYNALLAAKTHRIAAKLTRSPKRWRICVSR